MTVLGETELKERLVLVVPIYLKKKKVSCNMRTQVIVWVLSMLLEYVVTPFSFGLLYRLENSYLSFSGSGFEVRNIVFIIENVQ